MEIEDPDEIVGFKHPPRSTNIDYRSQLALDADSTKQLRNICSEIEDKQEWLKVR